MTSPVSIPAGHKLVGSDFDAYENLTAAWTAYTPTLTNLTQGNGTVSANYRVAGKTLDLYFKFTLGTTSSVSTSPAISLPSGMTMSTKYGQFLDTPASGVLLNDTGTAARPGMLVMDQPNNRIVIGSLDVSAVFQNITSTVPHTWASTDVISVSVMGIELT